MKTRKKGTKVQSSTGQNFMPNNYAIRHSGQGLAVNLNKLNTNVPIPPYAESGRQDSFRSRQ